MPFRQEQDLRVEAKTLHALLFKNNPGTLAAKGLESALGVRDARQHSIGHHPEHHAAHDPVGWLPLDECGAATVHFQPGGPVTVCYEYIEEVERIATFAFARAESRSRRICSVDKANVLASSALWRRTVTSMSAAYPEIRLEHMYVDNAAMQLTLRPAQFDVMLTTNMFGDILSDAAAALAGSIGVIPSASFGSGAPLFEPIHGSAPSLAGTDTANPIGSILSVTMMLRDGFGLSLEADWVEQSLLRVLSGGYRTPDIVEPGARTVSGSAFTELLREEMQRTLEHAERYGWGV